MRQYLDLLEEIMDHGVDRPDRTGVGTRAVFGHTMRFNMADGFPAMTTKRLYFHGVKAELLWFLRGSSDNRELQELGVHIWDTNENSSHWMETKSALSGRPRARVRRTVALVAETGWHNRRSNQTSYRTNQEQSLWSPAYCDCLESWRIRSDGAAALPYALPIFRGRRSSFS